MEALASQATSSSCQLQLLVERLTQELAQGAAADGAASQQQPAAILMGLGGAGSSQPPHRQADSAGRGTSTLAFEQQSPSGPADQMLARAAGGSDNGSRGFFGGKLGWHQAPPVGQQLQQDAGPQPPHTGPAGGSSRRQQQLAALNALRLQAGRGYALHSSGVAAARSDSAAHLDKVARALAAAGASPSSSGGSNGIVIGNEAHAAGADYHSSSNSSSVHVSSELKGQQQLREPTTHRKLRRSKQAPRAEQQGMVVAARPPLQLSGPAAPSATRVGMALRPRGTAASLNQLLQPLLSRSGRLYSASPIQHPLQHVEARTAAAAAAAADGRASAAEATEAAAAEVEVTTPAQRRAAVARINRLPALGGYILMGQHGHAETTAGGIAASGSGDVTSAAIDLQLEEDLEQGSRQADGPVACWINGLGTVQAPDRLKPSARVGATARGAFGDAVVDPHTLLTKKGGWWRAGLLHIRVLLLAGLGVEG
jgi:hypothetical protein